MSTKPSKLDLRGDVVPTPSSLLPLSNVKCGCLAAGHTYGTSCHCYCHGRRLTPAEKLYEQAVEDYTPDLVPTPLVTTGKPGQLLQYGHLPANPGDCFLWCRACGGRFSAYRDDYFYQPNDATVTCHNHANEEPMVLAREDRKIVILAGR